ncbi:MAG: nitrate reductase [Epsilonproteobacteria bacterium]|nr:nitrate reductase [Campylobacterota bacterium]
MRKIIILLCIAIIAFAKEVITFDGYISKIAFNNSYLVAGLENGHIIIQDKTHKPIYTIKLPQIHDFMDELIPMPIYSLDLLQNKLLITAGWEDSGRKIFLFDIQNKKLQTLLTTKDAIMKANFLTNNKLVFGFLSDEIGIYDISTKKLIKKQVGEYVFSTYTLNRDKTLLVLGDESGSVSIVSLKDLSYYTINGINKDKTLSVDIYKNTVLNASSDQNIGIYDIHSKELITQLKTKFLPYGAALYGQKFACLYDEHNNISVYDLHNKLLTILKGHTMPLNGLRFINAHKIISFSPAEIIIWDIK